MSNYLINIAGSLDDIEKLLKVSTEELAEMTNIGVHTLLHIKENPNSMTKAIALQIFMIANARVKFEGFKPAVQSLLALCFQIDELDTRKFMKRMTAA